VEQNYNHYYLLQMLFEKDQMEKHLHQMTFEN
jgi:hypothetical protein